MLKQLKRKFVIIVMTLVGLVLASVLGSSLYSSWITQQHIIGEALDRGLRGDLDDMPVIGGRQNADGSIEVGSSMLVMVLEMSSGGIVLETTSPSIAINSNILGEVIDRIIDGEREGHLSDLHVAWKSSEEEDGTILVAIADTGGTDRALRTQLVQSIAIIAAALAALMLITIFLANWVLKPVTQAWDQQRRFISDASHELKTPLAVIVANTEILQRSDQLSQADRRWVESTAEESRHMKNLVGDLLQLARTDEGLSQGYVIQGSEEIDLSELVSSAALEFDALAFERGCIIDQDIQPHVLIKGNQEWLERLVKILIDNACKYASPGSSISVSLREHAGHHCSLAVNNVGNVIEPDELPHLFERFYRSDKARSRTGDEGGFGLGLAIAKGIAEAHGGSISATSSEPGGTTFTVQF